MTFERIAVIEQALSIPGKEGMRAVAALKGDGTRGARSSLEPPGGIAPLNQVALPQKGVAMEVRRQWLDAGEALRKSDLFSSLSEAEAVVLARFMEQVDLQPGDFVVRHGDACDALYMIEAGEAETRLPKAGGRRVKIATHGPGELIGEISLLAEGERTADVVAKTAMRLKKLSADAYRRFITHMPEVESKLQRIALKRAHAQLRTFKPLG
jgi:hypothetical protein